MSQKKAFFIVTAVETSNLTTSELFVRAQFIIGFSEINLCETQAHVKTRKNK
jgi:hypothetical protein